MNTKSEWRKKSARSSVFIKRNLNYLRNPSLEVTSRKIETIFYVILPRLIRFALGLIPAILFLVVMRLVNPFVIVRITPINASRFGHLALDPEIFLAERKSGIGRHTQRVFDIWYLWHLPLPVSNRFLVHMWKREIRIWPTWLMQPVDTLNRFIPGGRDHEPFYRKNLPGLMNHVQGDPFNSFYRYRPVLSFEEGEIKEALQSLKVIDYQENSKHVCLVVRDQAHFSAMRSVDFSDHDFRNAEIDSYRDAAEYLEQKGYFVFRMGQRTHQRIDWTTNRIIDYAGSSLQSEMIDVFLLSTCEFCVSTGSGPDGVALAFRRPILFTNLAQVGQLALTFWSRFVPKRFFSVDSGDEMNLSQVISMNLEDARSAQDLESCGVFQRPNSSTELRNAVEEMHLRVTGGWVETEDEKDLQGKFLSLIPSYLKMGTIRGGISATFLESAETWTK